MPEFINHNSYTVHLAGPDGKIIRLRGGQRVKLAEYYRRYVQRGFISEVAGTAAAAVPAAAAPRRLAGRITVRRPAAPTRVRQPLRVRAQPRAVVRGGVGEEPRPVVGRRSSVNAVALLTDVLQREFYPISNGVGVGVLSYERLPSLRRLINSLIQHSDLARTTVFVSDDGSRDPALLAYLDELRASKRFVVLRNADRLGVAGNSNRLLRCLARFRWQLLLNDDVEVTAPGWDTFYFDAMTKTGFHHFTHRQRGVYGAKDGRASLRAGVLLEHVAERPHGAVMAFSAAAAETVGHFNPAYGLYGMEHVDWSTRVAEFGLQEAGFWDVACSESFFQVHAEASAVHDRSRLLKEARAVHAVRRPRERVEPHETTVVPAVSVVIPYRDLGRKEALAAVVNGMRGQRFPQIDLIVAEHDATPRTDVAALGPLRYFRAPCKADGLFNKAQAFNLGVRHALHDKVVLHDADMLCVADYLAAVADVLDRHEACHLGKTVIYTTEEAAAAIGANGRVDLTDGCDRVVGYYEGGSLACRRDVYWRVGGFNEDFQGYGCFVAGVPVLLADRTVKAIEDVVPGDRVITQTGATAPVWEVMSRAYVGRMVRVTALGSGVTVTMTPTQQLLVQDDDDDGGRWMPAEAVDGRVAFGHDREGLKAELVRVEAVADFSGDVYNLSVVGEHSYVAGPFTAANCEDCDFYARLSQACAWHGDRRFDLLHLWHPRAHGWNAHHEANKKLELRLRALTVPQRVELQQRQLRRLGYA